MAIPVIRLHDAWFEVEGDRCHLMVATPDDADVSDGFYVPIAFFAPTSVDWDIHFHRLAGGRDFRLFGATWPARSDSAPRRVSGHPLVRLEGPFRRGPQDVA